MCAAAVAFSVGSRIRLVIVASSFRFDSIVGRRAREEGEEDLMAKWFGPSPSQSIYNVFGNSIYFGYVVVLRQKRPRQTRLKNM